MRRCAQHIHEGNCDPQCPGIMHGTDVDDVEAEAHERLADFAEVTSDLDELPPQDSSEASAEHVGADGGNAPDSDPRR